ncbi:MAG: 4Fe-4S binding protein [Myxococcota bacterium]
MYQQGQNGLLPTFRVGWRNRSALGLVIALAIIGFYELLYFTSTFDPLARSLGLGNRWFLYGALYCVAMVGGGIYYLIRHGNSRYNRLRIGTNIAVQLSFGFSVPFIMKAMGSKDFYFSYLWPLKFDYLMPDTLTSLPIYLSAYCFFGSLLAVPLLAVFLGKRWYCSWICGCGGLANTFGDPWRHLTATSTRSWRFEQVTVHTVLIVAVGTTAIVFLDFLFGAPQSPVSAAVSPLRYWYGVVVTQVLAGVVGTGFYPLFGPRVWCRNFCPMAALLGISQKFGRFRIRVKKDMCISCGNCSTYCEMGIDVRSYAQNNESFTRASCVGCGMCAHMCPRGILKLENVSKTQTDKERQGLRVVNF